MTEQTGVKWGPHQFPSSHIARWAIYFDSLGFKWVYAPGEFEKDGATLRPDFWIPELEAYIELRSESKSEEDVRKCELLRYASKKDVYLIEGVPDENRYHGRLYSYWGPFVIEEKEGGPTIELRFEGQFYQCLHCGTIYFGDLQSQTLTTDHRHPCDFCPEESPVVTPLLREAHLKAMNTTFDLK